MPAKGTWTRLLLASLPAAAFPAALLYAAALAELANYQPADFPPRWPGLVALWLVYALCIALLSGVLRGIGKVRLRHHLLSPILLGVLPVVYVLWDMLEYTLRHNAPEDPHLESVVVENPHGCEIAVDAISLPWILTSALLLSSGAAILKWLTYGLDRQQPASRAWRIAGVVFALVLAIDLAGHLGLIDNKHSFWWQWMVVACEKLVS